MDINLILHLIPMLVGAGLLGHPELSGDALTAEIVDATWHALRESLHGAGWFVDVLRNIPAVSDMVNKAVASEMAKAQAQIAPPAPPEAPKEEPVNKTNSVATEGFQPSGLANVALQDALRA